jgi:hypothetical protein
MTKPLPAQVMVTPSAMAPLDRKELGAMIACIASMSGALERELAGILADIMEEHSKQALAMYLALSGSQARKSALLAAAKLRISDDDYADLLKLYKKISNQAGERNAVIHGTWGVHERYPTALLLCNSGDYAQFEAAAFDLANMAGHDLNGANYPRFQKKLSELTLPQYTVYELQDFYNIASKLSDLLVMVSEQRQTLRSKYQLRSTAPVLSQLGALAQLSTPQPQPSPDQSSPE